MRSIEFFPAKAFDDWLTNNPADNVAPEIVEWDDAQDRKKEILSEVFKTLEEIDIEPRDIDELDDTVRSLSAALERIKVLQSEYEDLDETFPAGEEPDPDQAYDDGWFE